MLPLDSSSKVVVPLCRRRENIRLAQNNRCSKQESKFQRIKKVLISENLRDRNLLCCGKIAAIYATAPELGKGGVMISEDDMLQKDNEFEALLEKWNSGDNEAMGEMLPQVYSDLRRRAAKALGAGGGPATLQPTALINEAYLRMINDSDRFQVQNKDHFLWFASLMMRRIVVDYARSKLAGKRGSGERPVSLDDNLDKPLANQMDPANLVALDEALTQLKKLSARQAKMVEMHYFAGLTSQEVGDTLGVSAVTVKREMRTARLWLGKKLGKRS